MASTSEKIDIEKAKKAAEHVLDLLGGAVVSGMIYLGDRMGLYQALNGGSAMTSEDLARKTGLHERWIREWLYGQAAASLIDYKGEGRFELSPESALVLANENSPFFLAGGFCALPQQMAVLNLLPESFKSGMGLTYDQLGPEVNRGVERMATVKIRFEIQQNGNKFKGDNRCAPDNAVCTNNIQRGWVHGQIAARGFIVPIEDTSWCLFFMNEFYPPSAGGDYTCYEGGMVIDRGVFQLRGPGLNGY